MRSPWHGEQHVSREERLEHQVLLGHFMERSTSAPPVSTDQHKFNGGGTLMEDSEVRYVVAICAYVEYVYSIETEAEVSTYLISPVLPGFV
jgi:hypothetical protein